MHTIEANQGSCGRGLGRLSLNVPVRLSLIDGEARCTLVDLSLDGAKVASIRQAQPGETALLKGDGFEAFGEGEEYFDAADDFGLFVEGRHREGQ